MPRTHRHDVSLTIGGVMVSRAPVVLRTLLGSCISACLYDPQRRIGGMNHFMLPSGDVGGGDAARFGVHAMELLIGALQREGAERGRLVAKVFGAGSVLQMGPVGDSVSTKNIEFIGRFLREERIPLIAQDLGGKRARQLRFFTDTGQAFVRKLGGEPLARSVAEEQRAVLAAAAAAPRYGEITLFD